MTIQIAQQLSAHYEQSFRSSKVTQKNMEQAIGKISCQSSCAILREPFKYLYRRREDYHVLSSFAVTDRPLAMSAVQKSITEFLFRN